MNEKRLRMLLERWTPPFGPIDPIDPEVEMAQEIKALGPGAAKELAHLLALEAGHEDEYGMLHIFCGEYFRNYPEVMTSALLDELGAKDPHLIVDLLAYAKAPGIAAQIIASLKLDFENHELIECLIISLRHIGDADARAFLQRLPREKLTPELQAKLDDELAWLARHPEHGVGR